MALKTAAFILFCLSVLLGTAYDVSADEKTSSPVIFVHGIASSAETWSALKDTLDAAGWTFGGSPTFDPRTGTVTSVSPGDFYTMNFSDSDRFLFPSQNLSFPHQGAELSAIIETVLQANPGKTKATIVAHSMGGLAARAYLQGLGQLDNTALRISYRGDVDQLITIGTPHRGAEIAFLCDELPVFCIFAKISRTSVAVESLKANSAAFGATAPFGLNNLLNNPLPTDVKYTSIIGTGETTILGEAGDGIVSVFSQNLRNLVGTGGLLHKSKEILIADRGFFDCGFSIPLVFSETHTCEPGDRGVGTELLQQISSCHLYTSASAPSPFPAGFGVPWNFFTTPTNELVLNASCSATGVTAQIHKPSSIQFHYTLTTGYQWNAGTSQWEQFTYSCSDALISGTWCPGNASKVLNPAHPFFIAHTCSWINNAWKCGCRDAACSQSLWQLQQFQR